MHPLSLVYKFAQNQTKLVPTNQNITTAVSKHNYIGKKVIRKSLTKLQVINLILLLKTFLKDSQFSS